MLNKCNQLDSLKAFIRERYAMQKLLIGILVVMSTLGSGLLLSGTAFADTAQPGLTLQGPDKVREGYFQLRVDGVAEEDSFVIELASSEQFATVENTFSPLGAFRQLSLSGFDDGRYYFRAVHSGTGEYSNIHQLDVVHYPLWQALSLFTLGALLFISLLVTMLILTRRSARNHKEPSHG
ncbi:hypothetical protein CWE14_08295 [Aliidiomarina soli]|uniref:Uncharacterized protein n=2 Tax=Aliidiomarina soli TaxID=1928574 RepID=A0A432WHH2_9GAMM|nr:hypothetical protein CWE14_08295 [Aliidiomarina soli]